MKARHLAGPMSAAVFAACFPGYSSKVVSGSPKTDFVKGEKREGKPKIEVSSNGNALTARAVSEITCYGSNVTNTPQTRVYERQGVDPFIGIGVGVASAALFGLTFASGICDPDDPRLFDFNKTEPGGGISTTQTTCDLVTAGGTLIGFSGALAYGATSVKVLTTKPTDEELAPEQKSDPGTQACGVEPLANEPIVLLLKEDKAIGYSWTDKDGNATFDLSTLIDPSATGGLQIAFAKDTATTMASVTEEQLASKRPQGWAPLQKLPSTGEASITRAHYEIEDLKDNAEVRRLTLAVKVKNTSGATSAKPVYVRAKIASKDSAGVNGRTIIWENLAIGAEEEKTITIDLPKALPDPSAFDIYLITKEGIVLTKVTAKTGPEEVVPVAPVVIVPSAENKAVFDKTAGQILAFEQIKFTAAKATIEVSSNAQLDAIAKFLNDNPDIKVVRIEGHTDDKGVAATNDKLSADRAAAVVKYLTTTGKVDAKRLFAKGYGSTCPAVANDSDANREKNRRIEFVVLGEKDDPKGACRVNSKK